MIDRRTFVAAALVAVAEPSCSRTARARHPEDAAVSRITAYAFSFPALTGRHPVSRICRQAAAGVNTASLCGYTPQYAGLQELWTEFSGRGFVIIGVPSNDFGGREPGGTTEIAQTAQHQYGVTFPIAAKTVVKGPNAHPFYKWAAEAAQEVPRWNFHKLVGRDGYIAEVFPESVEPTDTRVKTAIARALADS
jgi:glutathione peroxidase